MHREPTTRPLYGEAALHMTRNYQILLVDDGRLRRKKELNSWWFIGWMDSRHLRQSWICWPAVPQGRVHYQNVCVCQTDRNSLTRQQYCENQASHLNQMMRKGQMGTLKNRPNEYYFYKVILDIAYDLSSWTLHMTCYLVLLDIIYDLFSLTL